MHVAYRPSDTLIKQKWELHLLSLWATHQYRTSQDNSVEGLLPLTSANIRKSLDYPILHIAFSTFLYFLSKTLFLLNHSIDNILQPVEMGFFLLFLTEYLRGWDFFPLWLFFATRSRVTQHLTQWQLQRCFKKERIVKHKIVWLHMVMDTKAFSQTKSPNICNCG